MLAAAALSARTDPAPAHIIRTLFWDLLSLPPASPYRQARLERIADQLRYAVEHWPAGCWPDLSSAGHPVPTRSRMLRCLAALPADATAAQQFLLTMVRHLRQ